MLDFMDEDWFIITSEIVFLILVIYDIKQYLNTKKKEYLTNIVLTIGFAIWTLYPMYISYFKWSDTQKQKMLITCDNDKNTTLCNCIDKSIFKNYSYKEFQTITKNELDKFKKEAKEDCLDDSWF
jgi:hypothetical protein